MILSRRINFIRKLSIILFSCSLFALIGSLWLQNTLAEFKFTKGLSDEKITISENYFKDRIDCSKNIQNCRDKFFLGLLNYAENLDGCIANNYEVFYIIENDIFKERDFLFVNNDRKNKIKQKYINKKVELRINYLKTKNPSCIKNYKYFNFYKIFPFYFETLYNLKNNPKTLLGASKKISPFINGETSISNIVKRFPINYIFKTFLFISVIFMYLYWKNYKFLFSKILNSNYKFFYFGVASAIFLFLHVLFLGIEVDSKIFKLLRKLVIALFILSEIIAQFYLSIQLFKNRNSLILYCYTTIIYIKLLFIITISIISFFVISLLLFYDLSSKVDYILEWNYFAGLLFYYFFSFLMWKKN